MSPIGHTKISSYEWAFWLAYKRERERKRERKRERAKVAIDKTGKRVSSYDK